MDRFSRRQALALGGGLVAVQPRAAAAQAPEAGASLRVLRPSPFVDADARIFDENTRRFTAATGVGVTVAYADWTRLASLISIAANSGAGPDVAIGFDATPNLHESKVVDLTDLASECGSRGGGWYRAAETAGRRSRAPGWIGVPLGGSASHCVYRASWVRDAGFERIPSDLDGFLRLCRTLQTNGHPCGFSLGRAQGDAPNFANWLLWSHGARLFDPDGAVALDSRETRAALDYARALHATMLPGTLAWTAWGNNDAFAAGDIGLTQNGIAIYDAARRDPAQHALAADIAHAEMPRGAATDRPVACLVLNAMVFRHSAAPNAARHYLRFMMDAPQYVPWLTGLRGYLSPALKAFADNPVWQDDAKLAVFRDQMDTPYYDAYAGPSDDAASETIDDWIAVAMFARAVTGEASTEETIRLATRTARRHAR